MSVGLQRGKNKPVEQSKSSEERAGEFNGWDQRKKDAEDKWCFLTVQCPTTCSPLTKHVLLLGWQLHYWLCSEYPCPTYVTFSLRCLFKYLLVRKVFPTMPLKKQSSPQNLLYFYLWWLCNALFASYTLPPLTLGCKPNESECFFVPCPAHACLTWSSQNYLMVNERTK